MDKASRTAYVIATALECPDADTLATAFADGPPVPERAAIANHAASCPSCHHVISALMGWQVVTAGGARNPMRLVAGDHVDRYVIEAVLGAGGMGVVYAARDPDLGRRVAVKLLRVGTDDERLKREAQALARLSHPNVVAVHDVGVHDGQIFVAMALVAGSNLRQWLGTPRPVAERLRHLLAAGRGLAAAHAAGLVHRDLKPDNVFISDDGHALVGDFGLARAVGEVGASGAIGEAPLELTMTGVVLGTPAYMAPEQAEGEATAASDQFGLCVTAWETLYGERPYAGQTFAEIQTAVRAGRIGKPRAEAGVPSAVQRALVRGLAADPSARFPSVDALLAAMTPPPPPPAGRWRWVALAIGGLGSAAAATVLLRGRGTLPDTTTRCVGTEALLGASWNPTRRAAVERAVTAPGERARVLATVDAYASEWRVMRRQVCLATDARRPDLLASRVACLDQRARALRATLDFLIGAKELPPLRATHGVEALPTVDRCANAIEVAAVAESTALVEARVRFAEVAARDDDRLDDATAVRAQLEPLGDPALLLDALLLEATAALDRSEWERGEAAARRALVTADRLRDDLGRAHAGGLLTVALLRLNRGVEARSQLGQATAALARAGGDWEIGIVLGNARASVSRADGDAAGELTTRRWVMDEARRRRADDSRSVLSAETELWDAYVRAGKAPEAAKIFARIERTLQLDPHDQDATELRMNNAIEQAFADGDFERASQLARVVVSLSTELAPADASHTWVRLAQTYEIIGEWSSARDTYALGVRDGRARPDEWLVESLEGIARMELILDDPRAALAPAREAMAISRAGADAERVARVSVLLARALVATGGPDEVPALLEPVMRALDADPEAPVIRRALVAFTLARALWATGGDRDRDRARSLIGDAIRDFARGRDENSERSIDVTYRRLCVTWLAEAIAWQDRHP